MRSRAGKESTERYLVTGSSRGIGRAIAVRLAAPGRTIIIHGRDERALGQTCRMVRGKRAKARPVIADLSSHPGIETVVSSVGRGPLQVFVNNAGVGFVAPVEQITYQQWRRTLAVNVTAPFLLIRKLLPLMRAGSAIVNILSIAARTGFATWTSYCMSKFALEGFSQALREELRPRGIRVINVYPSATDTDFWSGIPGDWPRDKMLNPDEVAAAVAYAVSRPQTVAVENIEVGNITGKI